MSSLQPGQIYEIFDAYVGMTDKVPTRIIVHRLTDEQQQKRLRDQAIREKRKELSILLVANNLVVSMYIGQTPLQILSRWDKYMIGILYVGKSRFYLKHGSHFFIFTIVKDKT